MLSCGLWYNLTEKPKNLNSKTRWHCCGMSVISKVNIWQNFPKATQLKENVFFFSHASSGFVYFRGDNRGILSAAAACAPSRRDTASFCVWKAARRISFPPAVLAPLRRRLVYVHQKLHIHFNISCLHKWALEIPDWTTELRPCFFVLWHLSVYGVSRVR